VIASRRNFITGAAATFGFPTIVPSSVFGQNAPSKRITMAAIGWGMQGPSNTKNFMGTEGCQVIAACDIDKRHLKQAVDTINQNYGNQDCQAYSDYRELLARKDIDTVTIAIPDNWHALVATEAARQGKDIWGEKPLARTIHEQQAIVKAVQKHQRIWQTGSWQRSVTQFRQAAEMVRNGLIGTIKEVHVGLPSGHNDFAGTKDKLTVTPPPADLDYEMWIGPATMEEYIEGRIHKNWRWNYNIGGGQLLDWIGHHCDIAHWGMDSDRAGPSEVHPIQADFPPRTDPWNTATKYRVEATYAGNIKMTIAGGHSDIKMGTKWIGTEGWIWVDRSGFDSSNAALKEAFNKREKDGSVVEAFKAKVLGPDLIKTPLYKTETHFKNFIDCVKSREPTITPVETGHNSAIPGHLALIAMMTKRSIKWDSKNEVIIDDAEASKLLGREYRGPWKLEA
jgi:predicted dehydrogenase